MGYTIFEDLCKMRGVTPYKVAKDLSWNNSIFSNWKAGRSTPKADKRKRIADYFGVSLAYLDGEKEKVDPNIEEMRSLFSRLNQDGIEKVIEYASDLVASGRYGKKYSETVGA